MVSLCVIGQRGGVRKRKGEKEQESHPNQNGIMHTVSVLCNKHFPSDDDKMTSSGTTSHSPIALCKYIVHSTAL